MPTTNTNQEKEFFDAIANCQIDRVIELVKLKPELLNANDHSCFGATPITRVCFNNDRSMIKTLIELGADVDRRSDWSMGPWSPLHCAIFSHNQDLANFLLDNGAALDIHTAAGLGRIEDLTRLLNESPERVTEEGGDGCHPLHFSDSVEVAKTLIERGADIEARCLDHFSTPVQYLADKRPEVARYLFSVGANPDIFSAILADDAKVVEKLIQEDPNVLNARVNQETFPPGREHNVHNIMTFTIGQGSSPLHAVARGDHAHMVKFLVDAGHDPNVRGGYDDATPLHVAAWNDLPRVAKALLDAGADINIRSGETHKNSPAGWAIVAGSADFFDLLMDQGAETFESFHDDAKEAVNGKFRQYKIVPQENYERILARLSVGL